MKYRGEELKVGDKFYSELSIRVEFDATSFDEDKIICEIRDVLKKLSLSKHAYIEQVLDCYILIRGYNGFEFNTAGINTLKSIYDVLSTISYFEVFVNITLENWFKDGEAEYNNDVVTWSQFMANLTE